MYSSPLQAEVEPKHVARSNNVKYTLVTIITMDLVVLDYICCNLHTYNIEVKTSN